MSNERPVPASGFPNRPRTFLCETMLAPFPGTWLEQYVNEVMEYRDGLPRTEGLHATWNGHYTEVYAGMTKDDLYDELIGNKP